MPIKLNYDKTHQLCEIHLSGVLRHEELTANQEALANKSDRLKRQQKLEFPPALPRPILRATRHSSRSPRLITRKSGRPGRAEGILPLVEGVLFSV